MEAPYQEQNVLFDFYFDEPEKINSALYWIHLQMNPPMDDPYNQSRELMNNVIVIHGTEIVTIAHKNYHRYKDTVERMRQYADFGVNFKVYVLAAQDYDYSPDDFYDYIEVVRTVIIELPHWQQQDYSLIAPAVLEKKYAIKEIR